MDMAISPTGCYLILLFVQCLDIFTSVFNSEQVEQLSEAAAAKREQLESSTVKVLNVY